MPELRILNIEPGAAAPVVSDGTMKGPGLPMVPDCADCGANHYMHETPRENELHLICMSCGTDYTVTRTDGGGANGAA